MKKSEVKALMDIIYKDSDRKAINGVKIDKVKSVSGRERAEEQVVAVATDRAMLAVVYINAPDSMVGKFIPRSELEKWYKLAGAKDLLDWESLKDDPTVVFPNWKALFKTGTAVNRVKLDAELMRKLQILAGEPLIWSFSSTTPARAKNDKGIYLLAPMLIPEEEE